MKALLWKDFRENRKVLTAIGILVLMQYLIYLVVGIATWPSSAPIRWAEVFWTASAVGFYISVAIVSFIAGNAIAGERANRSAEFAAYLPIPPHSAVASKAVVAIGGCLFFLMINYGINQVATLAPEPIQDRLSGIHLLSAVLAAVLMFGVAWLVSSLSNSPVIAAVSGAVAFLVLIGMCTFGAVRAANTSGEILGTWLVFYAATCLIVGIGSFVVGVICYLRRVEP
jgi:ABC-type transport system involved in multi-copper enzyme maturation permease subunit